MVSSFGELLSTASRGEKELSLKRQIDQRSEKRWRTIVVRNGNGLQREISRGPMATLFFINHNPIGKETSA
jgi:hypothetical protein